MKKILAILLAVVMVVGMGVTGFATTDPNSIIGMVPGLAFGNAVGTGSLPAAVTIGTAVDGVVPTVTTGVISKVSKMTITIPGAAGGFYESNDGLTEPALPATAVLNAAPIAGLRWNLLAVNNVTGPDFVSVVKNANAGTIVVTIDPTKAPKALATYDLSFTLDAVTPINGYTDLPATAVTSTSFNFLLYVDGSGTGSTTPTQTPGTGTGDSILNQSRDSSKTLKITDFRANASLSYGYTGWAAGTDLTGRYEIYDVGTIRPADKRVLKMFLWSDMFLFNDGNVYDNYYIGSQLVRNSKLGARTQVAAGSKAIQDTTIDYDSGRAYVKVKFVEEWVSTSKLDFEFTTYLLIDNKRKDHEGQGMTFIGTLQNFEILVYANDDYVDTSLGDVAHAQDFVKDIEVDLGAGVSIFTKFFKDKKYYGTATRVPDEAADVVFARYPDVDNVVRLKTVGLNSTGDIVKLDTDYSDYYVYDENLKYLGQSNTKLPFSSRYYLANRKLDVDGDVEPVEDPEPYEPTPDTGGDVGPSNANANPGTGC